MELQEFINRIYCWFLEKKQTREKTRKELKEVRRREERIVEGVIQFIKNKKTDIRKYADGGDYIFTLKGVKIKLYYHYRWIKLNDSTEIWLWFKAKKRLRREIKAAVARLEEEERRVVIKEVEKKIGKNVCFQG